MLVGQESGATAYVKDLRLITDAFGDLIGSCFLRDPHTKPSPVVKIQSGRKNLKLTTSPTNEIVDSTEKFGVLTAETNLFCWYSWRVAKYNHSNNKHNYNQFSSRTKQHLLLVEEETVAEEIDLQEEEIL